MNHRVSSREDILAISKDIAANEGLKSINMRYISEKANVALGSIYNYFSSKTDLVISTIQKIAEDVFSIDEINANSFPEFVGKYYASAKEKGEKYPGLLSLHSLAFSKENLNDGKMAMESYFSKIKLILLNKLCADKKVNEEKFNQILPKEKFIDYLFDLFTSLLLKQNIEKNVFEKLVANMVY